MREDTLVPTQNPPNEVRILMVLLNKCTKARDCREKDSPFFFYGTFLQPL